MLSAQQERSMGQSETVGRPAIHRCPRWRLERLVLPPCIPTEEEPRERGQKRSKKEGRKGWGGGPKGFAKTNITFNVQWSSPTPTATTLTRASRPLTMVVPSMAWAAGPRPFSSAKPTIDFLGLVTSLLYNIFSSLLKKRQRLSDSLLWGRWGAQVILRLPIDG